MTVIDISLPLAEAMLVWPGDPPVTVGPVARLDRGDPANVSVLGLGTHTGTHVDPPAHFFAGGAGVDEVPLDALVGEAFVADATGLAGPLSPADLEALDIPPGTARLLLKTDNSAIWAAPPSCLPDGWVALSAAGAAWVAGRGVRLVGIDFLSIDAAGAADYPAHRALLGAGTVILEGLDLRDVAPGHYTLAALPLRLAGGDGAPARAVLLRR